MKIVQGDEQPISESTSVREGTLRKTHLLTGDVGSPGNFRFGLGHQIGDFFSPRHRHNFDQWRFQLEGTATFDRNGTMKPGTLGYFPEGAYYGPQASREAGICAVVQFGGPSGSGYLSKEQVYAASTALKAFGRFEKGVFHRNPDVPPQKGVTEKKTLDAFQATWEFASQRPMVYPKPQYADPILMDTGHYRWMPLDGAPGVEEKSYGTFTDCAIRSASYKLDAGAAFAATGRGLYLVLSGRGSIGSDPFRRMTAVYLASGESATFVADETSEMILLGLPEIERMRTYLPGLEDADAEDLAEV
jgi:hypothetical protein